MATCPRCGGYLGEYHRCAAAWRRWIALVRRLCIGAVAGATIWAIAVAVVFGPPSWSGVTIAAAIGALVTDAVLRGEPRQRISRSPND